MHFFQKGAPKICPPPLIESFLQFSQKGQRWTQYRSTICPGMFTIHNMPWNYFDFICLVRSTFFEGVRPMLELNILQQSDTSSPVAY